MDPKNLYYTLNTVTTITQITIVDMTFSFNGALGYYTSAGFGDVIKVGSIDLEMPAHNITKLGTPILAHNKTAPNSNFRKEIKKRDVCFFRS